MTAPFDIAGRQIGIGHPPYVIAEMSANHNGDIRRAYDLLEAAKKAGADAVKLQTYTADTMTIDHAGREFTIEGGLWDGRQLYDLYTEASTPWEWHRQLFERGRALGLHVFSTPFDSTAVDFLEELQAPAYKIASFELLDLPLIQRVAATGKPIIMSTGMADRAEIAEAVAAARTAGATSLALLHCVSGYPAPVEEANLRTIADMTAAFGCTVGLSDHTLGSDVAIAAVAVGASMIEKHVTLARADGGPDSAFSLEPDELARLCGGVATAWRSLGYVTYERQPSEVQNLQFRRSIYVVEDIRAGETLSERNVRAIRPGFGLPPKHMPDLLGRVAEVDIKRGTAMRFEFLKPR